MQNKIIFGKIAGREMHSDEVCGGGRGGVGGGVVCG